MSFRERVAGWIAGDQFVVVHKATYEQINKRTAHLERTIDVLTGEDTGGMLPSMMSKQNEMYTLNGFGKFDYEQRLGKRAKESITTGIGEFVKSMIHEAVELENWTIWKPWSYQTGNKWKGEMWSPEHVHEMRMEVIDLLAFVFNLCCLLGINPRMLFDLYMQKMDTNINERHKSGTY